MKRLFVAVMMVLAAAPAFAHPHSKLKTEEQKSLYAVGLVIARQLEVFELTPAELKLVMEGITDGVKKRPRVDFSVYSKKSQELGIARRDARGKLLQEKTPAFLEAAAREKNAVKLPNGAIYLPLREGEGASPAETDKVKLHQRGMLIDGREVESSYKRGEPDVAELKEFLPCITEGVKLMKPGGKARITCPSETGFGKESSGIVPSNAALVFEVELLEVGKPDAPK